MGYHHLALAARDMQAIHAFYEGVMGFELVKVEVAPVQEGGWAKHFFYRMEDDSKFIAFWELHDVPGQDAMETNLSKAAGVPQAINHIAFDVHSTEDLEMRRDQWRRAGLRVLEIDHNWCRSVYATDPNGNMVEFCLTTGEFSADDRAFAVEALSAPELPLSKAPGSVVVHEPL